MEEEQEFTMMNRGRHTKYAVHLVCCVLTLVLLQICGDAHADPGCFFDDPPIEVTQAIQTRDNSLPLVQDKKTAVRVYVKYKGTHAPCRVLLHGSKSGVNLPGSPLLKQKHLPPVQIDRGQQGHTANFILPDGWADSTVTFRAEAIDYLSQSETSEDVVITFTPRRVPTYWMIPMNIGNNASPVLPDLSQIPALEKFVLKVFPVSDVNFIEKPWQDVGPVLPTFPDIIESLNAYYGEVLVAWMFGYAFMGSSPFDLPEQIFGVLPWVGVDPASAAGLSDPAWGGGTSLVTCGHTGHGDAVIVHEITHNLGPGDCSDPASGFWGLHVSSMFMRPMGPSMASACAGLGGEGQGIDYGCDAPGPDPDWQALYDNDEIQEYGVDTLKSPITIIDNGTPDYMSYCKAAQGPVAWISTYRWKKLFDYFSVPPEAEYSEASNKFSRVYYISGYIKENGTGKLDPIRQLPGMPTDKKYDGEYAIQIVNTEDKVIAKFPILAVFVDVDGRKREKAFFRFQLPYHDNVSSVRLVDANNEIVDEIVVSKNTPKLKVVYPNGGEVWQRGVQKIYWKAHDVDDDRLTFSVFYTPDSGKLWMPVANGLKKESYEVDTSLLPGGKSARIRVVATDGFNTVQDDSDECFTVFHGHKSFQKNLQIRSDKILQVR